MRKYILLISVNLSCITQAEPLPLINSITMDQHHVTYYVNEQFHATYLRNNLFVTYQDDIDSTQLDYTIITMPLNMNTLGMIWVSGNDYYIDAMDRDLFESPKIDNWRVYG